MSSINAIRQFYLQGIVDNQTDQTIWRANGQILKDYLAAYNIQDELVEITLPKGIYDVSKANGNLVIDKSKIILKGETGNPEDVILKSYFINNTGYCQNTIFVGAADFTLQDISVYNRTPIDTNPANGVKKTIEISQDRFTAINCIFRGVDLETYRTYLETGEMDLLKSGDCYYIDNSYRVDKTKEIEDTTFNACQIEFGRKVKGQKCGVVREEYSQLKKEVDTIYNAISTVGWFNYDTRASLTEHFGSTFYDIGQVPIIKSYLDFPIYGAMLVVVGDNIVYTNEELEDWGYRVANTCTIYENGVELTNYDFSITVENFLGRATILDQAEKTITVEKNTSKINGQTNIQIVRLSKKATPEPDVEPVVEPETRRK